MFKCDEQVMKSDDTRGEEEEEERAGLQLSKKTHQDMVGDRNIYNWLDWTWLDSTWFDSTWLDSTWFDSTWLDLTWLDLPFFAFLTCQYSSICSHVKEILFALCVDLLVCTMFRKTNIVNRRSVNGSQTWFRGLMDILIEVSARK